MANGPFQDVAFVFPLFGTPIDYDGIDYAVEELAGLTNRVQITPVIQQETIHSSTFLAPGINPYPGKPNKTPTDEVVKFIIDKFSDAGFEIELKISSNVADDTWSGLIDPSDPDAWFDNYTDIIKKWASYAQERGCDTLILTNEMYTLTSKYRDNWIELINDVREVFDGEIGINAVVRPDEAQNISFADALDFIGLSVYVQTVSVTNPSVDDLVAGWTSDIDGTNWVTRIHDVHEQYQKPIQITEIGFASYDGAAANGNYPVPSGGPDQQEQRDQYEAFFRVFSNLPDAWFRGVSFWYWLDTYPDSPWVIDEQIGGPTGPHIDGKLAEATIREWLSGARQTTGLTFNGSVGNDLLEGGYNHDTFNQSSGEDVLNGGRGYDTAWYSFGRSAGDVSVSGRATAVEKPGGSIDLLANIERIQFTNGALIFDLDGENASFAYRIYAAAYGRTPDEGGLRFWTEVLDGRGEGPPNVDDKEFVASFFLTANEFVDLYGANPTDEQYINALYENVLKREADADGYEFWLGVIASGQGKDDLLIWFTESDENVVNTAPDLEHGIWVL